MAIEKTCGYLLRTTDYSETSLICRIITKEKGVVSLIAKGAKRPKNTNKLIHFNQYEFLYYEGKSSLHTLKESNLVENNLGLSENIFQYSLCQFLAEIILLIPEKMEGHADIYSLFEKAFLYIRGKEKWTFEENLHFSSVFLHNFATELGFGLVLDNCIECGKQGNITSVSIEQGGIICADCSFTEDTQLATRIHKTLYLRQFKDSTIQELEQVETFLLKYLTSHLEISKKLKSHSYLQQIRKTFLC